MTSEGESVTTDTYLRASFGAINNSGDKTCGGKRVYLDGGHAWQLVHSKRSHVSAGSAPSSCNVSHRTDWALHMGKGREGRPWDRGQGAVATPVPTVTRDLGLRGGTPSPLQAVAIFHFAGQSRSCG